MMGFFAGAVPGLFFWKENWQGGYASWRRRMIRLAHISFFGLGLINILFALSARHLSLAADTAPMRAAALLIASGAVAMPLTCYLSAWKISFRHLFILPVACMVLGVGAFILAGVRP